MKETFHIFCRIRTDGQIRIVRMAESSEAARREAEADGFNVIKIRRAPRPAGMGAPTQRKY